MRDLSRAQGRFLNLPGSPRPRPDDAQPRRVTFSFQVLEFLRQQLSTSGSYRGGPLFGDPSRDDLAVQYAAPPGYSCGDPELRQQPLALDERYVLGWSDCLGTLHQGRVDWVGNWLVYPDRQVAPLEQDLHWLRLGAETDLFNEEHLLLTVGWAGGQMSGRAHGFDRHERRPFLLPHDLVGDV